MKRFLLALFVLTTFAANAQKSVLLRANYPKGASYSVKMEQIQNLGLQGGVNMNMDMTMKVTDVTKEEIKTESTIGVIKMNMMQGGQEISFDSTKSEDELDQMGKMMKSQMDPILKSTITTTINNLGKTLSTTIDPPNPTMEQFSSQGANIEFPEEKVSVGSTWINEDENQGMKMKMVFKVTKISNGIVYVDISGDVSGLGEGTIKGRTEIEAKTGISTLFENEVAIKAQGVEVKVSAKITMKKM